MKLPKRSTEPGARQILAEIPIGLDVMEDSEAEDDLPLTVSKRKTTLHGIKKTSSLASESLTIVSVDRKTLSIATDKTSEHHDRSIEQIATAVPSESSPEPMFVDENINTVESVMESSILKDCYGE